MSDCVTADAGFAGLPRATHVLQKAFAFLAVALVLLVFCAPFTLPVHRLPQAFFDAEWTSAVLLAAAAITVGAMGSRQVTLRLPLVLWLCAMVALVAIQYVTERLNYPSQLSLACVYAIAILGAYWIGRALVANELRERALVAIAAGLLGGALFSVAIQWLQLLDVRGLPSWLYFEIDDAWYRTRPFANLGQANHLATYLVWALFAALFLHQRPLPLAVTLVFAFVIAVGLALTRSRMGVVFALAPLAACWLPTALRPVEVRDRIGVSVALVLGYIVGSFSVSLLIAYQGGAVDTALARFNENGGFSIRLTMWADALRVAASSPWLGTGFDQYPFSQYWLAQPGRQEISTNNVHNLVLQTAAELGWPMAMSLVCLAGWWAVAGFKHRIAESHNAFAWMLLAVVGAHALLEWPLSLLHFAIPAALLFALAEPDVCSKLALLRLDARLLVGVGVCGLLLAATMKLEFDEISEVTYRADAERRTSKGIDEDTLRRLVGLGQASLLRAYPELLLTSLRQADLVEATDEEIKMHERVMVRSVDARLIARLAILNAKAGHVEESVRHAQRLGIFYQDRYADLSKMILEATASLGAEADPLRRQLAAGAAASVKAPAR